MTKPVSVFSTDAGSTECGVVELVQRSVSLLPRELQPFACGEILLVGGTSKFPGMRERLWKDLRSSLPQVGRSSHLRGPTTKAGSRGQQAALGRRNAIVDPKTRILNAFCLWVDLQCEATT